MSINFRFMAVLAAVYVSLYGCSAYTDALSKEKVAVSSYYKHSVDTIDLPYTTALANLEKGLNLCAIDRHGPDVTVAGTGATRFVGAKLTHELTKPSATRAEYEYRYDGFIQVYAILEESGPARSRLSYHGPLTSEPLRKWAMGDNTTCHGYLE